MKEDDDEEGWEEMMENSWPIFEDLPTCQTSI